MTAQMYGRNLACGVVTGGFQEKVMGDLVREYLGQIIFGPVDVEAEPFAGIIGSALARASAAGKKEQGQMQAQMQARQPASRMAVGPFAMLPFVDKEPTKGAQRM